MSLEYLIASLQRAARQKAGSNLPSNRIPTVRVSAAVVPAVNPRQSQAK